MAALAAQRFRDVFSLLAAAALLLLGLAIAPSAAAASAPTVSAYDSLATIRSDSPLPPGGHASADISAAGNEFESFQITVQAGSAQLSGVRVDPGQTLTGPGGTTIPASNLTIYREANYQVSQRSDAEGATGSWPDALIPERDVFYGENRNAFPVDLPAGQEVTAWIDVLVPDGAPAGDYSGSIMISGGGGTVSEVPVHLTVYGFSIPSTSTLRSAFGISGVSLPGGDQALYAAAALNDRVTIANLWPFSDSRFKSEILPLLQGTDPRVQLPGARLTTLDAFHCAANCLASWRDLAQRYPIVASRFFDYICDEPSSSADWSDCNATAASADSIWPGVRKLITTDSAHAPAWATDLSPLVNDMSRDGPAAYSSWHSGDQTRNLWPYTSCRSYSCSTAESSDYNGWPGYAIDEPASQARAMGWLSFITGASGELYYNTTEASSSAWTDQYRSGGNGDGTLFYPGTPDIIGGTHPIPIESIRLKRIRDGREDYEYLHLLEQQGRGDDATAVAQQLFPALNQTTVSSGALGLARARLAALIAPTGGGVAQRTLTVDVTGNGSVTGPGINCPGDCSATYSDGTAVTLDASTSAGSILAGWAGACSGNGSCRLLINSDARASATFTAASPQSAPAQVSLPQARITAGPAGKTTNRSPVFRFASSVPSNGFKFRLDSGAWHLCSSSLKLRKLAYRAHRLFVRARDASGNLGPAARSRTFMVVH
jgi:hypothetical protein